MDVMNPVLAQKMGLTARTDATDEEGAVSPIRIMRRAMARAADKAVGMSASVLGMSDEEVSAEELIENAPDDWIALGLRDGAEAGLTGVFLIDPPLRSALVEMQTMGALLAAPAVQRRVTRTDAALTVPFAAKLLSELEEAGLMQGMLPRDSMISARLRIFERQGWFYAKVVSDIGGSAFKWAARTCRGRL